MKSPKRVLNEKYGNISRCYRIFAVWALQATAAHMIIRLGRSEERRVGKECRSRGAPEHKKKKKRKKKKESNIRNKKIQERTIMNTTKDDETRTTYRSL